MGDGFEGSIKDRGDRGFDALGVFEHVHRRYPFFSFLVFVSSVRAGAGSLQQQVRTSRVGNLKMTLLENNF
jgi:hypothetical protein